MNTQVLEYLIAISEEHSLTRAAERFYLSQPSLSHHLANVERELGAKLFRKEGRALWPTEEGVIFINKARAILHAEAQARQQIEALRVQARPCLRLCMDTAEEAWFRQKVQPHLERLQVRIECTRLPAGQALTALEQGEQDLALLLVCGPPPQLPCSTRTLWQDEIALAVPAAAVEKEAHAALTDLCYLRFEAPSAWDAQAEQNLTGAGITPHMVCTAPDQTTASEMVAAGHAFAFLPRARIAAGAGLAAYPAAPAWQATLLACFSTPEHPICAEALPALLEVLQQIVEHGLKTDTPD